MVVNTLRDSTQTVRETVQQPVNSTCTNVVGVAVDDQKVLRKLAGLAI